MANVRALNGGLRLRADFTPEAVQDFVIAFDYGDVSWLRGYCHLLSAICETVLAYDKERLFQAVGDQLFDSPDVPRLPSELFHHQRPTWERDVANAIAAIHLASFPLKEPKRMKAAHEHFAEVIRLSRESWKAIDAETDDDHEWVPNSKQQSVIPNVRVSAEMIAGWHEFLDEAESLLVGGPSSRIGGLRPNTGSISNASFRNRASLTWCFGLMVPPPCPMPEKGQVTSTETWQRVDDLSGGQFVGFALWFN